MTKQRQISVNIWFEACAKNKVMNPTSLFKEYKTEVLKVFKEAEATEKWSLIPDKVKELVS